MNSIFVNFGGTYDLPPHFASILPLISRYAASRLRSECMHIVADGIAMRACCDCSPQRSRPLITFFC
jgi:hypothetical protein